MGRGLTPSPNMNGRPFLLQHGKETPPGCVNHQLHFLQRHTGPLSQPQSEPSCHASPLPCLCSNGAPINPAKQRCPYPHLTPSLSLPPTQSPCLSLLCLSLDIGSSSLMDSGLRRSKARVVVPSYGLREV